jgi:ring-1,2-phenylacetyl-CoA epoxidase subunit PaaD
MVISRGTAMVDEETVWNELKKITDPEIPVLSLVEMRIIRSVTVEQNRVQIVLSPTFVGCPALEHMKDEIREHLKGIGCTDVTITLTFSPPWSTDMLDDSAREKLTLFGITPPPRLQENLNTALKQPVACPFCHSTNTRLENAFGATLCRQLFYCDGCLQSFERFKPL